jgi:hypothetical protein
MARSTQQVKSSTQQAYLGSEERLEIKEVKVVVVRQV